MTIASLSQIIFLVELIAFLLVRIFFSITKHKDNRTNQQDEPTGNREGKVNFMIRRLILTPALAIFLFLYFTNPPWMKLFSAPFPRSEIWLGAILGLCGLLFLIWVHKYLGKEWSVDIRLGKDHRLIQSGPYSRIRHPMYTALFAIYFSFGLVLSNYIVMLLMIMIIVSLIARIPKEEQTLIERFGDEYRSYMQKTGRFFPKL